MTKNVLVFAGTNEGREICEFLCNRNIACTACVATDYGSFCLENIKGLKVLEGRLDKEEIEKLAKQFDIVIDASHPYADLVSENIKSACPESKLIRIIRESDEDKGMLFDNFSQLCNYLKENEGNVLLSTGSKDLHAFCKIENFEQRLYPRVLPSVDSLNTALNAGYKPSNIICMQGPFTKEMNIATINKVNAKFIVSKDTGKSGGFKEKLEAAKATGAKLLTIARPNKESGKTIEEVKAFFSEDEPESKAIEKGDKTEVFPLFLSANNKNVLVVGAGKIGARRINTLKKFNFNITVIDPNYKEQEGVRVINKVFERDDIKDYYMVIATTNIREVNHSIYSICKERNILVNVCDNPKECDFYFPAVFESEDIIGGVVSKKGNKHTLVKEVAQKIRDLNM